jgi:hypothetical protein
VTNFGGVENHGSMDGEKWYEETLANDRIVGCRVSFKKYIGRGRWRRPSGCLVWKISYEKESATYEVDMAVPLKRSLTASSFRDMREPDSEARFVGAYTPPTPAALGWITIRGIQRLRRE